MTTATVEGLDDATSGSEFREMGFSIEKVTRHSKCSCAEGRVRAKSPSTGPQGDPWSGR